MAVRKDNIPPRSAGSITQKADADIDRIGNISNVSRTVSNMQKDVKQRLSDTQRSIDESQSVSMVQRSMSAVLDKLAGTVEALSKGIKTITIDTAKATKDVIGQYGKAIGEDISYNKQSMIAMSLAKATPLYGYFAAKFMETDVFKKAAERMKASIGKVFGSVAGIFRRGRKGKGNIDDDIPKMARGGYVKKGGLAQLHAGEMVAPIEKILKRIDDSITITKDLAKITEKTSLHLATDLKGYIKSSSSSDKKNMNVFRSLIRTWKEVSERTFTEKPEERMARSLLAIQDILGAQIGTWKQVQDEMLANHPTLVKMKLAFGLMSGALTAPYKIIRAFMRVRGWGGYRAKLSKSKNPLQATAENIASLYVDLMWRLDNIIPILKLSAQANRDVAAKLTGNTYPRVSGIPKEKNWSIRKVASKVIGTLPGLATSIIGQSLGGLGGLLGKGKGKLGSFGKGMKGVGGGIDTVGQWLMEGGQEVGKKKRLKEMSIGAISDSAQKGEQGATSGPAMWVTDTNINKVALDYQEWVKYESSQIPLDKKLKLIEYKTTEDKYKFMKADRVNALWGVKASKEQVSTLGKLRKTLAGNKWLSWLLVIGGFLKATFMRIFGGPLASIMRVLGLTSRGRLLGSGVGLLGNLTSMFGKGGMMRTAVTGFKSLMAPGPILAVLMAAGVGVAIGTWLNNSFIKPFLDKLDKKWDDEYQADERRRRAAQKTRQGTIRDPNARISERYKNSQIEKIQAFAKTGTAEKQMQGFGIFGDQQIAKIQGGQKEFQIANMNEYLQYDANEINQLREKWIASRGKWATRNAGQDPKEYGRSREEAFLWHIRQNLTRTGQLTDEQMRKKLDLKGPATYTKISDKQRQVQSFDFNSSAAKIYQSNSKWSSENEDRREAGKKTGFGSEAKKIDNFIRQKTIQTLMKGKHIGTGWWNQLDAKSRQAFKDAKKYYMTKENLTEAEADAKIQGLVMDIENTYGLIRNPESYKNIADYGKDVYKGVKDKLPQAVEVKEIAINEAHIVVAGGIKAGVDIGNSILNQTEKLVDGGIKAGAATGAVVVNAITNTANNVSKSSVVQGGMGKVGMGVTAGMDYWDDLVYKLDSD